MEVYGVFVMDDVIRIKTFGGFSMSYGDKTITDQDNRSKKLWLILEYLIAFHDRNLPQASIIDLIWNEDSITSDPENALKTSLHRIRALMDDLQIPEKKLIIRKQGTISWNRELPCEYDFEEFISYCNKGAVADISDDERLEHYRAAFDLYKGDFLPKCHMESWSAALATRYRSIYMQMIVKFMEVLLRLGKFEEMADRCSVANAIDPMNSDVNYYLIYSLYKIGNKKNAIEQYNRIVNAYYDEFGVEPEKKLLELYEEITVHEEGIEADLNTIQEELTEKEARREAYICDYSVFQHYYKIEARACARNGMSVYIMLITIKQRAKEETDLNKVAVGMEKMENVIASSLRSGDIFARYSKNQFIVMLPTACYENSLMIGERILKNFDRAKPKTNLNISYTVRNIEPQLFDKGAAE